MDFRLLGPVQIWSAGREWTKGWVKPRPLLAALLLDINCVVTVDRLIDVVWDDHPPRTARNSLQALVSRIRRVLADASAGAAWVETHPAGYRLHTDPLSVDLHRCRKLVNAAGVLANCGDIEHATRAPPAG